MSSPPVHFSEKNIIHAATVASMSLSVTIREAAPQGSALSIEVSGPEPISGSPLTRTYDLFRGTHLTADTQRAYLDLFESFARDFGMRVPASRRRGSVTGFTAQVQALLTETVSPDILYGYGDPSVLRVMEKEDGSCYYMTATSGDAPESFPILRSRDLRKWELTRFVFPAGEKPPWAADIEHGGEYWAPEIKRVGGRFTLCFAARDKDHSLGIGLAHSSTPDGPFVAVEQPLIRGGVIDPHLFVDEDGSATLFWKEDNNDLWPGLLSQLLHRDPYLAELLFTSSEDRCTACFTALLWPWLRTLHPMERFFAQQVVIEAVVANFSHFRTTLERMATSPGDPLLRAELSKLRQSMRTVIVSQQLDVRQWRLHGKRSVILENDLDWEGHLVEGASVTRMGGKYYMFYSGNDFSTAQYGIGVGVSDSLLGPYKKNQTPFLRSTSEWWGPGHPSVADGPDGRPWLFFHAYRPGHVGYKQFRALLAVPLSFTFDGVMLG